MKDSLLSTVAGGDLTALNSLNEQFSRSVGVTPRGSPITEAAKSRQRRAVAGEIAKLDVLGIRSGVSHGWLAYYRRFSR